MQELIDFISNHGKVFTNVNDWIAAMSKYDFYIGSRIHGVNCYFIIRDSSLFINS